MTDDKLIAWVEKKFKDEGYSVEIDEWGREWFYPLKKGEPKFSFKILIFATNSPEPEVSYYVGVKDSFFQADEPERVVQFFDAVFTEGCRLTLRIKGSMAYREKLEICQNGHWEEFANGGTLWWPFWKKERIEVIEIAPIKTR